jgi:hypothetical protein
VATPSTREAAGGVGARGPAAGTVVAHARERRQRAGDRLHDDGDVCDRRVVLVDDVADDRATAAIGREDRQFVARDGGRRRCGNALRRRGSGRERFARCGRRGGLGARRLGARCRVVGQVEQERQREQQQRRRCREQDLLHRDSCGNVRRNACAAARRRPAGHRRHPCPAHATAVRVEPFAQLREAAREPRAHRRRGHGEPRRDLGRRQSVVVVQQHGAAERLVEREHRTHEPLAHLLAREDRRGLFGRRRRRGQPRGLLARDAAAFRPAHVLQHVARRRREPAAHASARRGGRRSAATHTLLRQLVPRTRRPRTEVARDRAHELGVDQQSSIGTGTELTQSIEHRRRAARSCRIARRPGFRDFAPGLAATSTTGRWLT